jgi:hypothetical protein
MDSHNFGANYQNTHFRVSVLWVGLHQFWSKNFRKRFLLNFRGQQKNENSDFCHFLQFLKSFFFLVPGCRDTYYSLSLRKAQSCALRRRLPIAKVWPQFF